MLTVDVRVRFDAAHRQPVAGEAAGHVVEQRPQSHHVGVQDDAGPRHPVGTRVHDRDLDAFDDERPRLDGDVVDRSFFERSHRVERLSRERGHA